MESFDVDTRRSLSIISSSEIVQIRHQYPHANESTDDFLVMARL